MPLEQLIAYFAQYIPLKNIEKNELKNRVIEKRVKRRQFILQENDVCKYYSFVVSGCFKMYRVDDNGAEHNIQFAAENDWIADIGSFHSGKPSRLYIEAIEPSVILQIDATNLIYLYHNHPKFDRIFRVIAENKFIELQNRVLQNISSTGDERYQAFLEQYPKLANRLPNTQIASYIGITPEFLSKIRRKDAKK
ncbi:cAMP-binding domain of CRP or a regulatory subunit of cAMP-dependent protein kinases [Chitinophaga rupis]|uniref:cAMP-binding domain of CRP or a regulatory subunit of cAMP-dependent protein kinases n=1 Tax=Chitinophaga rupis TaxID=573321 RepID=A0A1H8KFC1_9BACT|nr:Crp/Fnr family transcriptional regulator [Chitinophaga rupis]SEN91659.1 cAMP-binding domain of CRP or a regulatory subunit of cAMP-dependent protein kinases [Chitinophaga rupis]